MRHGWLCVAVDGYFLDLLTAFASGREGYGNIAISTWGDFGLGIVGNGAATRGIASRDEEVGTTRVAEMETVGDFLARREAAKIMLIAVEDNARHLECGVVARGTIWVLDERDVRLVSTATDQEQQSDENRQAG